MALLVLVGYAIALIVDVLIVVDAYKQGGALHLCLCLFIPFYALYWLLFKMENRGRAILALVISGVLTTAPSLQARYAGVSSSGGSCSLLTAEQVAAELDGPFNAGETLHFRDIDACQYSKSSNPKKKLMLGAQPCDTKGHLADLASGPNDFVVHDLGDEAIYADGVLSARKGSVCYTMGVEGIDPDSTLDRRKNLMRTLLAAVK